MTATATRLAHAIGACALLLLAGCATVQKLPDQAIELVKGPGQTAPVKSKLEPGPYTASSLAVGVDKDLSRMSGQSLGYVRQREIERQLASIHKRILDASGITGVPGTVTLIATDAPVASCSPDGNIYVSMYWLNALSSEDELAALIAHETAHVLLHHHSTDIIGQTQKRAETLHMTAVAVRSTLTKTQVSAGETKDMTSFMLLTELTQKVLVPVWGRRQETEADLLGFDLLVNAGYVPHAMQDMLGKLEAWEKQNTESRENFDKRIGELAKTDLGQAAGLLFERVIADVSDKHPDTGQRIEALAEYHTRHYEKLDIGESRQKEWEDFRKQPRVAAMLKSYDDAFSASALYREGKPKEALALAQKALRGEAATHAYPNWLAAKSAAALNDRAATQRYLDTALKSPEPAPVLYTDMIAFNEEGRRYKDAMLWIERAEQRFADNPEWLVARIRINRLTKKTDEVGKLVLQCGINYPEAKRACDAAAAEPPKQAATTKPAATTRKTATPAKVTR
ncbi:MAG TPA: M48 family metalloprotease [Pseudorhodoferax sp.]|nr:M48 family metalloprotease [Pseudorhodoferax sp.]